MRTKVDVIFLFLSIFTAFIGNSSQHAENATSRLAADSTTATSPFIVRKKTPGRIDPGGNRLSLINSRFNRRPRKKNLDPEHLLEIIGDFYDPNWMSIEKPPGLSQADKDATYVLRQDAWPYKELTKAVENVNLSKELSAISGTTHIDANAMSVFKKWLLKKASCPVKYSWEDIGTMFWPRWIRIGACAAVPGTCSWPPGMHCVETGRSNLHILRWQCKTPKGNGRRKKQQKANAKKEWNKRLNPDPLLLRCQWIRVPYPITSACHCTC